MQDGRSTACNITHMLIPKVEMIMMQVPQRVTMVIRTRTEASQRNGYGMIKGHRKHGSLSQPWRMPMLFNIQMAIEEQKMRKAIAAGLCKCPIETESMRKAIATGQNDLDASKMNSTPELNSCVQRIPARHVIKSV